jgi:hypothetical protein
MYIQTTKCKLGMSYLYHGIFGTDPELGYQSWYWTVLGTGPLVRTASSRGGPVLDLGTGRPVLS